MSQDSEWGMNIWLKLRGCAGWEARVKTLMLVVLMAVMASAQNAPPELSSEVPAPRVEDVQSMDGILHATYDVISGPAGGRDWNRFRSLFVPQARFTRASKTPEGKVEVNLLGVDDFVTAAGDAFKKEGFYENAIVNRVQRFGNVAQVFSSYESRHAPGAKPFQRGINSIQLLYDGKRWWVLSILWDEERPDNPLPAEFARRAKAK